MKPWNNTNKVRQFFHWWKTGLSYCLPVQWREYLWPTADQIHVSILDEEILLSLVSFNKPALSEEKRFNMHDKHNIENTLQAWLARQEKPVIYGLIPNDLILTRPIVLPKNAMENIDDILSFELERKTPFNKTQVYFDYTSSDDENKSQSTVTLFIALREKIDSFLANLNNIGITINVVTHDANLSINLLPEEFRLADRPHDKRILPLLTIASALCLVAALYLPLFKMEQDIQFLETKFTELRTEALALAQQEKTVEANYQRQNFLIEQEKNRINELAIIKTLTELLPDDTYLTRYIHKQGELQLQGESSTASDLIEKLENNRYFYNTQFRSAITKNAKTNKERFHIISKTKKVELDDGDA